MSTLHILIADDYEVLRQGVRALIQFHAGWEVCGEAENGREAVEKAGMLKPDVVVMDFAMPELNGLEATLQILKAIPQIEVVIFTKYASEQLVRQALDAGAHGYVLKSATADDLVAAIEALGRHEAYFSESVAKIVVDVYRNRVSRGKLSAGPYSILSPREREILQLLAEGKSNRGVAKALNLSAKTVETHRAHIMAKVACHSMADLVRYAIRNNIIEP